MPAIFKTILNMSIWILFVKGLLIVLVTIYTFGRAYLAGNTTPMTGVAACAAGSLALGMTCVAVWIRKKVE